MSGSTGSPTAEDYTVCAEMLKAIRMFANSETTGWTELLKKYEADPCHPKDFCMDELAALEINPIAWLYVLALAFSLQRPEQ